MTIPSIFFTEYFNRCGTPGAAFVCEIEAWKRPAGVVHPTIRRIDWRMAAEPWPGEAPSPRSVAEEDVGSYRRELFVWARAAWRGFFAPQLGAIVPRHRTSFDGRECHPFTLGYVRGAVWQLLEHAGVGERWSLRAFIEISATADLFGLEWVDDIEGAIEELKEGAPPPGTTRSFHEGARRGIEDMECYLDATDLEPRHLVEWFESVAAPARGSEIRPARTGLDFEAASPASGATAPEAANYAAGGDIE